jgi:hypothetical protein
LDPTGHDRVAFWLAHGHPALMVLALVVAGFALRAGLQMRRRRLGGQPPSPGLLATHLRVARPAVVLMCIGLLGGPASAVWLRGWAPFQTFHAWLGVLAAALFLAAGFLGMRLARGDLSRAEGANLHGLLGTVGMLAAGLAAAAGMVLLP